MRVFDADIQAANEADHQREAWLIELDFPGGAIRATTADKTLTHDSNDYSASGLIVALDLLTERADAKVQTVDLQLAPLSALMTSLASPYQFSRVNVYWTSLDEDHAIIDGALLAASYYMSHHTIRGEEGMQSVALTCYSGTLPYRRKSGVLSSDADQKARFATDDIMKFTDKIIGQELSWGGMTRRVSGRGVGGGRGAYGHDDLISDFFGDERNQAVRVNDSGY